MFVSFLLPHIDRGQGPLFHWVMLRQLAALGADNLAIIADDRYFEPRLPWGQEIEQAGLRFQCPSEEEWERMIKLRVPETVWRELDQRCGSMLAAFRVLLTEDYPPLSQTLHELLAQLHRRSPLEAVLTWCNVPSLTRAAGQLALPVIHNELGPLRPPLYQGTFYFDPQGVNGRTSAAEQMRRFARDAGPWNDFQPLSLPELQSLLLAARRPNAAQHGVRAEFAAGAALQVEDDSNLLAFANGLTNFDLIFHARRGRTPQEVLIRRHPRGHLEYGASLGVRDDSPDSIQFIDRCQAVYTINSSVAFECLLFNKPVFVLGDSPAGALAANRSAALPEDKRLLSLNYLFLCYLAPASLLFDAEYYRWRLTRPSLREIYELHLATHRRARWACSSSSPRSIPALAPKPSNDARFDLDPRTVLFVLHEASRTGAPIFLLNFARWLQRHRDWQLRFLLRRGGPLEKDFQKLGETTLATEPPIGSGLLQGVDLVYSNTATNGNFLKDLSLGSIPLVTHVHELPLSIRLHAADQFEEVKRHTQRFIACSKAVADGLVACQGVAADRIDLCYEAVSVAAVLEQAREQRAEDVRAGLGMGPDDFLIGACGSAIWRKGPDLFLQLARRFQRSSREKAAVRFLWIGLVPDDERGQGLRYDLERLGLTDLVQFTGEQENPCPLLAAADAFCLPSREDPFPLVMLEAAALGKPTVCFKQSGGAPEFCAKGGGVAVPYLDTQAMAQVLQQWVKDVSACRRLGEAAARLVAEEFDFDRTGEKLAQVLETVAPALQAETGPLASARRRSCPTPDFGSINGNHMRFDPTLNDKVCPNGSSALSKLLTEAEAAMSRSDYAAACAALDRALEQQPELPDLLLFKGNVLYHMNNLPAARTHFARTAELVPTNVTAHISLAAVELQLGRLKESENSARAAIRLEPEHPAALKLLGNLCLENGRFAEAIASYDGAIRRTPTDVEARLSRARCHFEVGNLTRARRDYECVLARNPDHAVARQNLAKVVEKLGQAAAPKPTRVTRSGADSRFARFRLQAPLHPPQTYQQIKQLKIEMIAAIGRAASIRDYGGLWGVHGLYLLEGARALGCRLAEMIDVNPVPEFQEKVDALRKVMPVEVRMTRGDFREARLVQALPQVEVSLLYEVLLHQDNAVEVIKNVAAKTIRCVCIAQPVMKEELFALPNGTVNLQFYPEELKDQLRYAGWWGKEPTTDRFSTGYWMWGQTASYLQSVMHGYGWQPAYFALYEASEHWHYAMMRFVPRPSPVVTQPS